MSKTEMLVLRIPPEIRQKLDLYAKLAKGEISGLGIINKQGNMLIVEEVFLLEQQCSSFKTKLSRKAISELLTSLIREGHDTGNLKLWWHSHVDMSISGNSAWSIDDDTTIGGFQNDWMASLLLNRKGEYVARLDVFDPFRLTADVSVEFPQSEDPLLRSTIEAEIKEKVKMARPKKAKGVNVIFLQDLIPPNVRGRLYD